MPARDPKFKLLVIGVVLMAAGGWLEVVSRGKAPGSWQDTVAPWIVLAGSILTLLYFVVRRISKSSSTKRKKEDSVLFGESTTMQAPVDEKDDRRS